jgi:hypothetical protein
MVGLPSSPHVPLALPALALLGAGTWRMCLLAAVAKADDNVVIFQH